MVGLRLDKSIEGFEIHLKAERRSSHTIRDYNTTLRRFCNYLGAETPVDSISTGDVRDFLAHWSGATVIPRGGIERPARTLSPKTIKNMHTALSSFWTWLVREEYAPDHIVAGRIQPPRVAQSSIEPFSADEIKRILDACNHSGAWETRYNGDARYSRPTADRDRAIVLFLLDTGCRASEVANLRVGDLNLQRNTASVLGKGGKPREVVYSPKTGSALFRYLAGRETDAESLVFVTRAGRRMRRENLLRLIQRMGERAGVPDAYPHKFRHTFAISYLRNGGDIYTLQAQLGHSSLDMVKRYLRIAGADVRRVHKRASPVENIL